MSVFTHCHQCGRKLRDAVFCPRCGQCLCSFACLDEHVAQHGAPTETPADPIKSAIVIESLREGRGIQVEGNAAGRANPPGRFK
jgi:hypothetical protein